MARPDGDRRGSRHRPGAPSLRRLPGRFVQRRPLCGRDPLAPATHQFLRVPRLPHQPSGHLQAHRGGAAPPGRCPLRGCGDPAVERPHRGLSRRAQRPGAPADPPEGTHELRPGSFSGNGAALPRPAPRVAKGARRASPDGVGPLRCHPGLTSAGELGRGPAGVGAQTPGTRTFCRGAQRGAPLPRLSQTSAAAVPGGGGPPSCVRRARAARRRHGPRQDGAGHCGLHAAARAARNRAGAGGVAGLPQGRMGGTDRNLLRSPRHGRVRRTRGAPRGLRTGRFLHALQL